MTIANITYNDIITEVKNWVKTNCVNITNYSSIDSVFKTYDSGDIEVKNTDGTGGSYTSTIRITLKSQAIQQETTGNVDTAMNSWISSLGITPSAVITDNQLPIFFNNMVGFCTRYMAISTSQYSDKKYLIFVDTGTSQTSTSTITDRLIKPYTVTEVIRTLKDIASNSIKAHPVIYDYGQ